jgi:hypothetical protein
MNERLSKYSEFINELADTYCDEENEQQYEIFLELGEVDYALDRLIECCIGMYKELKNNQFLYSLTESVEEEKIRKLKYISWILERVTSKEINELLKLNIKLEK